MDLSHSRYWCRWLTFFIIYLHCNDNLQFSIAQTSAPPATGDTTTSEPLIGCNLTTQCFLNQTLLDPLLNCTVNIFGETDPPCYGHWSSASSCSCNDPFYRISSTGALYFCNDDGTWDTGLYDLQCLAPCMTDADEVAIPRDSNGNVTSIIKDGDYVTYSCPEGYIGSGTQKVDCNDGIWEQHEQFTCTEIVIEDATLLPTSNTATTDSTPEGLFTTSEEPKSSASTTGFFTSPTTAVLTDSSSTNSQTQSLTSLSTESTAGGSTTANKITNSASSTTRPYTVNSIRPISTLEPVTNVPAENITTLNVETDPVTDVLTTANGTTNSTDSTTEIFTFKATPLSTVETLTTSNANTQSTQARPTTFNGTTTSADSTTKLSTFMASPISTVESLTNFLSGNLTTTNMKTELTASSLTTTNGTMVTADSTSNLFTFNTTQVPTVESTQAALTTSNGTTTSANTTTELFTFNASPISTTEPLTNFPPANSTTTNVKTDSTHADLTTSNGTTKSAGITSELLTFNATPISTVEPFTNFLPENLTITNIKTELTSNGFTLTTKTTKSGNSTTELVTVNATTISTVDCKVRFNSTGSMFTSPGYPNEYGRNLDCTYEAEAFPEEVIQLSFTSFSIYKTDLCSSHYVSVYDGGTSEDQMIAKFCGDDIPFPVYSSENTMVVTFKTNSEEAFLYQGFEATFSFIKASILPSIVPCDIPDNAYIDGYESVQVPNGHTAVLECFHGYLPSTGKTDLHQCDNGTFVPPFLCNLNCNEYFNTSLSTFSSPGFPVHYDNYLKCYYRAETSRGYVVMLTFLSVDVEQHTTCNYDYVSVYDGSTEDAEQMSKICGDYIPLPMYSTGKDMLVIFITDYSVTAGGFQAMFTFVNKSTIPPREPCFLPTDTQYFSNSEEPLPHRYTAFIKCSDGFLPPEPVNLQCSNGTFEPYLNCNSSGCTSFFQRSPSYFTSPSYPSYNEYLTCFYTAEAPTGNIVSVTFTAFGISSDMLCRYDFVLVYDGNTTQEVPIAKFCGDVVPETVYTTGNTMVVTITTDAYTQQGGVGFEAYFTFISNMSIPSTENCYPPQNGSFVGNTGEEVPHGHTVIVECDAGFLPGGQAIRQCVNGTFYPVPDCNSTGCLEHFTSSPSFFSSVGSPMYEKYLTCSYSAESPHGFIIELTFTDFSVYKYDMCEWDTVSVFDGISTEDDQMATLCGFNVPCPLYSTGNRMLITFKTDQNTYSPETGFKATLIFLENSTVPYNDICYPPAFAHLVNEATESVPHGHTAVLECDEGFLPTGEVLLQCCNGTFSPFFACKSEFTTIALTTSVTTESVSSSIMSTSYTTIASTKSSDGTTSSETTLEPRTDSMSSVRETTVIESTTSLDTTELPTTVTTLPATTTFTESTTSSHTTPPGTAVTTIPDTTTFIESTTSSQTTPPGTAVTTIPDTTTVETTVPEEATTLGKTSSFDPTTSLTTSGTFPPNITTARLTTLHRTTQWKTTTQKSSTLTLTTATYNTTSVETTTEKDKTSTQRTTANGKTTKDSTTRTQWETTLPTTVLTTIDPCNIVFNMKEGSFKSPGNGSSYYNDLSCTYSAIAPQGKITVLAFDIFKLQEDPLCRFDVLKVYNGLSSENQFIAMLCGYDMPESVVSLGREMLVTFKSDEMLSYEGFQASFVFLDESTLPRTSNCDLPEHSDRVSPYDGESSPVPHSHTAVLQCNEGFKPEEPLNIQCTNGSFEPPLICIKGESFLQRRYILPHLTSTLEPVIYNLGFMGTDLTNTTFVRVQTSTGRNLGNFYGGVINTFQHSLPEEFGQTWERSTLEVQSTGNVHLYISTTNFTNQFLGYPIDWLGTDYLISTSPPNPSSSIIVTATEVDTKLSVFFPSDFVLNNVTYHVGEDLRRTLFELQSFSIKTPFDPSGTYIKASKPVAVMMELRSEDRNKLKSCSSSFYVPPISSWGTSYSFAASLYSNISFSITAAYGFTMVTVIPQPVSCGESEYNLMLDSWSKKDFNNYIGCRIEVVSNQSVLVLMTEYSNVNICNTMVVPSTEMAVKGIPGVPVFVSADQASTNLKVWVSNGNYQGLQVDGDDSYTWEVIGEENVTGTIVETRVEQGYHVVSSTSEEARLLITVDKKLYAAHEESKEGTTVCPFDRLYYSGVELTFNATLPGKTAQSIEVCETTSSSNIPLASRNCSDNLWEEPVLVECYSSKDVPTELERIANTTVTEENVDEIASKVALLTSQTEDLTPTEVDNAAESLEAIVETGSTSPDVTDSVVGTVNNLMEIGEDTLANAGETSTIIVSLEQQVSNVQQNPDNFTEVEDNVGVKAVKIDPTITKAITFANLSPGKGNNNGDFYGDLTEEKTVLFNDEKEVKDENSVSSIYLPPKILQLAEEADPNNVRLPISFLIYKDSRLFQTQMSENIEEGGMTIREDIFSQVITATVEIEDLVIDNLSSEDAVIARFATADVVGGSDIVLNRTCVFWVVGEDVGIGNWSDDGCYTNATATDNGTETVCHCTHLTSFAVLFRVGHTEYEPIRSLDIITVVGTSLSVAGLTACIFTFILIKKLRIKQPTKVHINLCLCLIGFYVSFLFGDLAIDKDPHCRNFATATHYFCLATIAWTCTEAVNMYLLFVKYSRSNNIKFFIPVSFILCYGLPIIPTLLVYFLDDPRELKDYCFLHPGNSLYYGLLLEIVIMIVFNIVVFTLVVRKVVFRPMLSTNAQNNKNEEVMARIQQFVLFWVLLGLSWTFGFFVAIPNRRTIAIEVLFCIFTSLQGFVLFFFICVRNPEIKATFQTRTKRRLSKKEGYQMKDLPSSKSMSRPSKTDQKLQRIKSSKRQVVLDTEDAGVSSAELAATHSTFTGMDLSEGEALVSEERKQADYRTIDDDPEMTKTDTLEADRSEVKENGALESHGKSDSVEYSQKDYMEENRSH